MIERYERNLILMVDLIEVTEMEKAVLFNLLEKYLYEFS